MRGAPKVESTRFTLESKAVEPHDLSPPVEITFKSREPDSIQSYFFGISTKCRFRANAGEMQIPLAERKRSGVQIAGEQVVLQITEAGISAYQHGALWARREPKHPAGFVERKTNMELKRA